MVDEMQLGRYRFLLQAKRAELLSRLTLAGETSGVDDRGDLVDQSARWVNAEVRERLETSDVRLLQAVEGALARLELGSYGYCLVCERPIASRRLKAVPWTRWCLECKDHSARR